jgi:hypothetical protein
MMEGNPPHFHRGEAKSLSVIKTRRALQDLRR